MVVGIHAVAWVCGPATLHRLLLESRCPVEIDHPNLTLSYSKQYESAVANAIRQLKTEYRLEIEDISS